MVLRFFTALALGAALASSPALAQDKKKGDAAAAAPKPINYVVNTDQSVDRENLLYLDLSTGGRVAIRLMPEWAPAHIERIKTLVRQGFYDGIIFHRVIDGFMAQTGDPTGTGQGG
ncbi:MAG: peptidylprolyl isomerase, partial [Novosphingobium sp.]|nr:peptidylprolyl isomerase [Novosphingobium sp.]